MQVFGCIISLKHGRMGLLSLAEVPGWADRWCSRQWIWMEMYSWIAVLWPLLLAFLLFLSLSALLLLKQKTKKKIAILAGSSPSLLWVLSGYAAGNKPSENFYHFIVFIHGFHGSFLDLAIFKRKKKPCLHTRPPSLCAPFLALFLEHGEGI